MRYKGLKTSGSRFIAEVTPYVQEPPQQIHRTHVPAFPLQQDIAEERPRRPAFQVPPVMTESRSSRNGSQRVDFGRPSRRRFGSNVKQPVPVPGKFANSLIPGEKCEENLSTRVSDLYAHYQSSQQTNRAGTISVDTKHEGHAHFHDNVPSTSTSHRDGSLRSNEKRKLFPSDEASSVRTVSKTTKPNVCLAARVSVGNDSELIGEQYLQGRPERKTQVGGGTDKTESASCIKNEDEIQVQKGEIFLMQVNESNSTTTGVIKYDSRQTRSPATNTHSSRKSASPMSRWKNLEKMRIEALNKNKKAFSWADEYIKSKELDSLDSSSRQTSVYADTKRHRTLPTASSASHGFHSPSHDVKAPHLPLTPSNLVTSITKLKASTPTTPEEVTRLQVPTQSKPGNNRKLRSSTPTTPGDKVLLTSVTKLKTSSSATLEEITMPGSTTCTALEETTRLKAVTCTTPGKNRKLRATNPTTPGDQVLLVSEYPTPDNVAATPSSSPNQSPSSEGSYEDNAGVSSQEKNVSDVESEHSSESSKHAWAVDSPNSIEVEIQQESISPPSPDDSNKISTTLRSSVEAMQLLNKQTHRTSSHADGIDVESRSGTWDVLGRSSCSLSTQHQETQNGSARKRGWKRKVARAGANQNMKKQKRTKITQSAQSELEVVQKEERVGKDPTKHTKQNVQQNTQKVNSPKYSTPSVKKTQRQRKSPVSSVKKGRPRKTTRVQKNNSPSLSVNKIRSEKTSRTKKKSSPSSSRQPRKTTETKEKNSAKSKTVPKLHQSKPQRMPKGQSQTRKQSKNKVENVQGPMKNMNKSGSKKRNIGEIEINDPYEYKNTPKKVSPKRQAKRKAAGRIHNICQLEDIASDTAPELYKEVAAEATAGGYLQDAMWVPEENEERNTFGSEHIRRSSDGSGPVEDDILTGLDDDDGVKSPDKVGLIY